MIDSPIALVVVLGLVVAAPMLLRRAQRGAGDGLRILARTAITKGSVVAVVTVDHRRMLIGAGDRGIQLLAELDVVAPDGDPTTTTSDDGSTIVHHASTTGTDWTGGPGADARTALASPADAGIGPGIGLVDRLRAMTVRTPTAGRPIRVPFRR